MEKIRIEDLEKITQRVKKATLLREGAGRVKITVHMGTCGISAGAKEIMDILREELKKNDIHDVILTSSGCAGLCSKEPMATVELKGEEPVKYIALTAGKALKIFNEHVLGARIVKEYALAKGSERLYQGE